MRMRAEFDLRLARTAIRQASDTAVAPSYIEALATCMPVSAVIMDWYS